MLPPEWIGPCVRANAVAAGGDDVQCVKQKHSLDRASAGLAAGLHVWDGTGLDDTVAMGTKPGLLPCYRAALPCLPPSHDRDDDGSIHPPPPPPPPLHMTEHPPGGVYVHVVAESGVNLREGGNIRCPPVLSLRLFLASGDGRCCQEREPTRSRIGCRLLGLAACLAAFSVPNGPGLIASPTRCPAVRVPSGDGLMAPEPRICWQECVPRAPCSSTSRAAPALEASRAIGGILPWFYGEASADRDSCVQRWLEGDMKHSAASLSDPGHANMSKVALLTVRRRPFQPSPALEPSPCLTLACLALLSP